MKPSTILLAGFFLGVLIAGTAIFVWLDSKYKHQVRRDHMQITQQAGIIENYSKNGYAPLVANVLDLIDDELKDNPKRTLSDQSIDRIVSLCFSLKPYARAKGDSVPKKNLSPERGYLLRVLSGMKLDAVSMRKIKSTASFSSADLREADLSGIDLSGIDLRDADLYGIHLTGSNLNGADLSFANLWGANLSESNLRGAKLKRANLSWADLNGADMREADFNEADLISAQLRKADMRGAKLRWADLSGAFLNESNLDSADMFRTVLKRAVLVKANLHGVNLNNAIVSEANLTEVNLTEANLLDMVLSDQYWTELLDGWKVTGAQEIQGKYKVIKGVSYENSKYKLVLIEN
jgi:uncharacterized protein YjbI with pentapeptide repeats